MNLREYQLASIQATRKAQVAGINRVMVLLPTGAGKTVIMATLPNYCLPKESDTTVILVNRDELVQQTVDKLRKVHPNAKVAIEQAKERATGDERFVVASVQTLQNERLADFFKRFHKRIGLMQVDECHHSISSTYTAIIERLLRDRDDALLFGVTATANRLDKRGLGSVYEKIVYERDMRWAISEGWLVTPKCYRVSSDISLDDIKLAGNDFAVGALAERIDTPERNDLIVQAYLQHTPGLRAIAFTPNVAHATHLAERFQLFGVKADWASGALQSKRRKAVVAEFRAGTIDVLVNCSLFVEGFDAPEATVFINARPTKSQALLIQMFGRVLRPLDDVAGKLSFCANRDERRALLAQSAKPFSYVLDLVDGLGTHGVMTIPSLWGLPPKLVLRGETLEKTAENFEELEKADPAAAAKLAEGSVPATQIEVAIEEVSAFQPPRKDASVPDKVDFDWQSEGEDCWILTLPDAYSAKDSNGQKIPDFSQRIQRYWKEAKKKKVSLHSLAVPAIGYEPETFCVIEEKFRIEKIDDRYVVTSHSMVNNSEKLTTVGTETKKNEAFYRTEKYIEHNRRDVISAISSRAAWRSKQTTIEQISQLSEMGVPLNLIPATQGDAVGLMTKLEKRQTPEAVTAPS